MDKKVRELFINYNKKNINYVFLLSNSISVLISKMLIEKFQLNERNLFVFSFRNTDASLITNKYINVKSKRFDSIIGKIFWNSPAGLRILKKIPNSKFILLTEWAYRESEKLINHRNCIEHVYLEMGQHSYMNIPTFSPKGLSFKNRFLKNWKNRLSEIDELAHFYFRDDASLFIGMIDGVFPKVKREKVFVLDNYQELKNFYIPKLKNKKVIGLTCASRRIKKNNLEKMLNTLFKKIPKGSIIKAHPSFYSNKVITDQFKTTFSKVSKGEYLLCPNNVILELEILFENKIFYGSKTALSRYARKMGSEFHQIKLY